MGQWQCKASAVAPSEASCRLLHHKKPRAEFYFRKSHHLDRSLSVSWQRMRCRPQRTNRALSSWQTVPLQSPQIHYFQLILFKKMFESMMFSKIHDEEACRESKTAPTVQFSFQERWRAVCLESVREPLLWFGLSVIIWLWSLWWLWQSPPYLCHCIQPADLTDIKRRSYQWTFS